jgi:hypothetical protein
LFEEEGGGEKRGGLADGETGTMELAARRESPSTRKL